MSTLQSSKAIKAVLLCGIGQAQHDLYPFNAAPTSTLPILNVPLLHYQFRLLERSGFDNCEAICFKKDHGMISDCAEAYRQSYNSKFKVKIHIAPPNATHDTPVCEIVAQLMKSGYRKTDNGALEHNTKLRLVIDSDVLILPCDVISTDPLTKLCAYHHHKRATFTMMLTQSPESQTEQPAAKKGGKDQKGGKQPTIVDPRLQTSEYPLRVGINHDDGRLVTLYDGCDDEFEQHGKNQNLSLHKNVLRQMTSFTLYTNLRNPAIYAFSHEAIGLLNKYPTRLKTFSQLAVLLVEMQFAQLPPPPSLDSKPQASSLYHSFTASNDIASTSLLTAPSLDRHHSYLNGTFQYKQAPMDDGSDHEQLPGDIATLADDSPALSNAPSHYITARPMSECPKKATEIEPLYKHITPLTCFAIVPPSSSLIIRCTDLNSYQFLNKKFAEPDSLYSNIPLEQNKTAQVFAKCTADAVALQQQLQQDAETAALATAPEPEAAPIKGGKKPQQQQQQPKGGKKVAKGPPRTNITGATWFGDGCQVGQSCIIVNSIIGHDVVIHNGVSIKDSIIMNKVVIGENAKLEQCIIGAELEIKAGSDFLGRKIASSGSGGDYDDEDYEDEDQ